MRDRDTRREEGVKGSQQVGRLPALGHLGGDRHPEGMHAGVRSPGGHRPGHATRQATQRGFHFALNGTALALALPAAILRAIELQREEKGAAHEARNNSRNAGPGQLA